MGLWELDAGCGGYCQAGSGRTGVKLPRWGLGGEMVSLLSISYTVIVIAWVLLGTTNTLAQMA